MREYYKCNSERIKDRTRQYQERNKEKVRQWQCEWLRRYRSQNPERAREASRKYMNERRRTDSVFRIISKQRIRISGLLRGYNKSARTLELIGCTPEYLHNHIESQFTEGMNWNNYGSGEGKWQVDHILSCASSICPKRISNAPVFTGQIFNPCGQSIT
jgi:hypothetical protein